MRHNLPQGRPVGLWDGNARASSSTDPSVGHSDLAGSTVLDDEEDDTSRKSTVVTERRAAARQRQIDIGKGRPEYVRYLTFVPKDCRSPTRPRTPDPGARVSKRQFDRQLSEWRRLLHEYDDPDAPPEDDLEEPAIRSASGPRQALSSLEPKGLPPSAALLSDYRRLPQTSVWPSMYDARRGGGDCSMSEASSSSGTSSSATATAVRSRPSLVEPHRPSLPGSYSMHASAWDGTETVIPNPASTPSWRFAAGSRLVAASQRGQQPPPPQVLHESSNTGSRLRASCREAASALPGGLISDPSEPMKVLEFNNMDSSEPITVTPSFDGSIPFGGRKVFECAFEPGFVLNAHSKTSVEPEDCPVTL